MAHNRVLFALSVKADFLDRINSHRCDHAQKTREGRHIVNPSHTSSHTSNVECNNYQICITLILVYGWCITIVTPVFRSVFMKIIRQYVKGRKCLWSKSLFNLLPLILLFISVSCTPLISSGPNPTAASTQRVADPGLDNEAYAERLRKDGWNTELLNTASDADYLDDDKKNLVLAHNLVRSDPEKFARLYVNEYISYFEDKKFMYPGLDIIMITREGVDAALELFRVLNRTSSMSLLRPSQGLSKAAASHIDYITDLGIRGHGGQGGLRARIERQGDWDTKIGENIAYGNFSAHDALLYLLIDDHVRNRNHRKIILSPDFLYIGVAKGIHPNFPTGYSYVINYAHTFTEEQ